MVVEADANAAPEAAPELPDSVDVAGAVALMGGIGEDPETVEPPPDRQNAQVEGGDDPPAADPDAAPDSAADPEPLPEAADGAPEFWSADDKASWEKVPTELRPVLRKYEQQRIAFANTKAEEAASKVKTAEDAVRQAIGLVEHGAAWWQQNGPAFHKAFADKWSSVDWNELAANNPAKWAELRQQRDNEAAMLVEANRRGQADRAVAQQRALAAFAETQRISHAQLAAKLPEHFGEKVAAGTYQKLGAFLHSKGISVERINAIHEAPIIELALSAMRWEEAKKQASTVTTTTVQPTNRTPPTTPRRVAPGPATAAGNQGGERARQAGERVRNGRSVDDADEAAALISALGH
jgi:hypothetical protein